MARTHKPSTAYLAIADRIIADTLAHGGGTYHARTGDAITNTRGYYVGGALDGIKVDAADPNAAANAVAYMMHMIPVNGNHEPMHYLGTWMHDGIIYIDAADHHTDAITALDVGRARGELSIWDIKNAHAVFIGYDR